MFYAVFFFSVVVIVFLLTRKGRSGRSPWPMPLAFGLVAFTLSLAHLPRETYLERGPDEPDASFLPRAIREIARANA